MKLLNPDLLPCRYFQRPLCYYYLIWAITKLIKTAKVNLWLHKMGFFQKQGIGWQKIDKKFWNIHPTGKPFHWKACSFQDCLWLSVHCWPLHGKRLFQLTWRRNMIHLLASFPVGKYQFRRLWQHAKRNVVTEVTESPYYSIFLMTVQS